MRRSFKDDSLTTYFNHKGDLYHTTAAESLWNTIRRQEFEYPDAYRPIDNSAQLVTGYMYDSARDEDGDFSLEVVMSRSDIFNVFLTLVETLPDDPRGMVSLQIDSPRLYTFRSETMHEVECLRSILVEQAEALTNEGSISVVISCLQKQRAYIILTPSKDIHVYASNLRKIRMCLDELDMLGLQERRELQCPTDLSLVYRSSQKYRQQIWQLAKACR